MLPTLQSRFYKIKAQFQNLCGRISSRDFWAILQISRARRMAKRQVEKADGNFCVVRLLGNWPHLWRRIVEQTPNGSCCWNQTLFVADGPADIYVVVNSAVRPEGNPFLPKNFQWPPRERVWGLHMEPSDYVKLLGYDQPSEHTHISRFYTNCEYLIDRGGIYRACPPYSTPFIGKSWNFLNNAKYRSSRQRFILGVICSHMADLEGHKERHAFLEKLDQSGIPYALWGRGESMRRYRGYQGFAPSKWEAHSQCRYSIVLENSVSPWYWSEKLADSLLGFSLPLYYGCPRAADYLPTESFIPIDIREPDCIEKIQAILKADPFEERLSAICDARRILLHEQNTFAFLDREVSEYLKQ